MSKKLYLEYDPLDGEPCADGLVQSKVEDLLRDYNASDRSLNYKTSSEILVDAVRLQVLQGNLNYKELMFVFEGSYLEATYAALPKDGFPKGCCNTHGRLLRDLVKTRAALESRRAEEGSNV